VASHAHSALVAAELALHVAHIRADVPGGGHGLLVRTPVGRAEPRVGGPVEEFERRCRRGSQQRKRTYVYT